MNIDEIEISRLFDLEKTIAAELFWKYRYPFEVLPHIKKFIETLGSALPKSEYDEIAEKVWAHKTAQISDTARIYPPAIICENVNLRQGAFIRGAVLVGKNAVVGNSVELKNSILFDGACVPHFNYVGDSVLGYKAHLGAGAITCNQKIDKSEITIRCGDVTLPTGLKKVGAFIGDFAEIGANSALNPGSVVGRNAWLYPLSAFRGCLPENSIYKALGKITARE